MKVKRYKHARKYLGFYRNIFKFREPHQILIDGTFTQMALMRKINIKEQLPKYLGGEVQLITTKCVLVEVESLGKSVYGGYLILKRYQVRRCCHGEKPVSAFLCMTSMIADSNKNHYFIATQDPDLTSAVNRTPGTPLLYIHFNTIVLEKPSGSSVSEASALTAAKVNPSAFERTTLAKLKGTSGDADTKKRKRRRGPRGPNPLSVKKKLKKNPEGSGSGKSGQTEGKKRKRRRRVKIASHTREEIPRQEGIGS